MAKLKLDLHDIFNRGHLIEAELERVMNEAVETFVQPACAKACVKTAPSAARPACSPR
jgi:hypothetical protein